MSTSKSTLRTARKTLGAILLFAAGFASAYLIPYIRLITTDLGGILVALGALVALSAIVLIIFWPSKWPDPIRKILAGLLIAALVVLGINGQLQDAFNAAAAAPWYVIAFFAIGLLALVALLFITILDRPAQLVKRRSAPARGTPITKVV